MYKLFMYMPLTLKGYSNTFNIIYAILLVLGTTELQIYGVPAPLTHA